MQSEANSKKKNIYILNYGQLNVVPDYLATGSDTPENVITASWLQYANFATNRGRGSRRMYQERKGDRVFRMIVEYIGQIRFTHQPLFQQHLSINEQKIYRRIEKKKNKINSKFKKVNLDIDTWTDLSRSDKRDLMNQIAKMEMEEIEFMHQMDDPYGDNLLNDLDNLLE